MFGFRSTMVFSVSFTPDAEGKPRTPGMDARWISSTCREGGSSSATRTETIFHRPFLKQHESVVRINKCLSLAFFQSIPLVKLEILHFLP